MKKILLSFDRVGDFDELYENLSKVADVEKVGVDGFSLKGVDIFIGKKLTREALQEADKLQAVFAYKTGVDDFPLEELAKRNIPLYNSHINSALIAQYAFSLATALTSRLCEYDRNLRKGNWTLFNPYWDSLFDMKVGLIGFGGIGKELNKILRANHILTYTVNRGKAYEGAIPLDTVEDVCKECDLIVASLPETPQTVGLFDEKLFALLKGKYLVNVGRESCINEKALYEALKRGEIAGVALDAWTDKARSDEDVYYPFECPLNEFSNVILSPHKAVMIADGIKRYARDVGKNVLAFLRGETPRNRVDCKTGY